MPLLVNAFTQSKTKRTLVGKLWQDADRYCFEYDRAYLNKKTSIPIGPEMPLQRQILKSPIFFASLQDRIPSVLNPEYPNYCKQWNIDPKEGDPLILISTIGQRGPSSFIFRKVQQLAFDGPQLKAFRKALGLTLSDLADFLGIQAPTIVNAENGNNRSFWLLKYCSLLNTVPAALEQALHERGQFLHDDKIAEIKKYIAEQEGKVLVSVGYNL